MHKRYNPNLWYKRIREVAFLTLDKVKTTSFHPTLDIKLDKSFGLSRDISKFLTTNFGSLKTLEILIVFFIILILKFLRIKKAEGNLPALFFNYVKGRQI